MPSNGNVSRLDAVAANTYSDDAHIFVKTKSRMLLHKLFGVKKKNKPTIYFSRLHQISTEMIGNTFSDLLP